MRTASFIFGILLMCAGFIFIGAFFIGLGFALHKKVQKSEQKEDHE